MKNLLLLPIIISLLSSLSAADSELWKQFVDAKKNGTPTILPDFSYSGYDYSESAIPDTFGWTVFDVTDHGAVPNDGEYDDTGIQNSIDAAEAAGGGIVFFPPGQYRVGPTTVVGENIRVNGSNILLKGSGAGPGGTEIFQVNMKVNNGRFMFEMRPEKMEEHPLTEIVADAPNQSFEIQVADTSNLSVGQHVIVRSDSIPYAHHYYGDLGLSEAWTEITQGRGFIIKEVHEIAAIEENTVRFREPLQLDILTELNGNKVLVELHSYNVIENVGIEDIRFKGGWNNYPEEFVHHKNKIHDYAWNALRIDNVANGWIRNCEFKDWSQCVYIDGCSKITVTDVQLTGKKGHMSIHTRGSYGVLVKDSVDTAGHWHGPGTAYWGCSTVYLRYEMAGKQSIDCHSGSPYATLMDNVSGGHFEKNGGALRWFPHHGKGFVAWNFTLDGTQSKYRFWTTESKHHHSTYASPIFVGLQGTPIEIEKGTYLANESQGQAVQPASLFEAQLALRLSKQSY